MSALGGKRTLESSPFVGRFVPDKGALMKKPLAVALLLASLHAAPAPAQRNAAVGAPFILETSYWIRPGQTDRFLQLLNKNKMPLLRREMTEGRILWMRTTRPRLSSADPKQPDLRLTIAWRDSVAAWDDLDPSRFIPAVVSDEKQWRAEEVERESLLLQRSDIPIQEALISPQ
jgi:hypothetical protein